MRERWGATGSLRTTATSQTSIRRSTAASCRWATTDSERAFCWLLQCLRQRFGDTLPAPANCFDALHGIACEIGSRGEFNFLLSNGDCLIAHASTKLAFIVRKAPFAQAHLKDEDVTVDFSDVTTPDDRVAVIATIAADRQRTVADDDARRRLWLFEEGVAGQTGRDDCRAGEKPLTSGPDRCSSSLLASPQASAAAGSAAAPSRSGRR